MDESEPCPCVGGDPLCQRYHDGRVRFELLPKESGDGAPPG